MKSDLRMIAFASASALISASTCFAEGNASTDSDGPLMRQVTIAGETFEIAAPYREGHPLNAAEASVLNQTFLENIRNNVAGKIKGAKELYAKDNGGSEDGFSIDTYLVPGEGDAMVPLRKQLAEYADTYEFGVRVTRNAEPVDPVQREARVIARDTLNAAIKNSGSKRKDISEEAYEEALSKLAARDDIQKEATRRVKQRSNIGSDGLDLAALLGAEPAPEAPTA